MKGLGGENGFVWCFTVLHGWWSPFARFLALFCGARLIEDRWSDDEREEDVFGSDVGVGNRNSKYRLLKLGRGCACAMIISNR